MGSPAELQQLCSLSSLSTSQHHSFTGNWFQGAKLPKNRFVFKTNRNIQN